MKSKIKNVPKDDLDAIVSVGSKKIASLQRRYSSVQMEIIEERALFKKKLDHWEAGYTIFGRALMIILIIAAAFGYIIGPQFIKIVNLFKLNERVISSMIWFVTALAIYNIADIGRIWLFFPTDYYGRDKKREEIKEGVNEAKSAQTDDKALVELIKGEIAKQGGLSTTNIINLLKIDINPRELGMLLKESGFTQRRGRSGRIWETPTPPMTQSDDTVMTED